MRLSRNVALALVCVILGVILAWQFKSIDYNQKVAAFENKRSDELKDELIKEKKNNDDLRKRNEELEKQKQEYENARGNGDKMREALQQELEKIRIIAGLADVKGKGVIITLNNSEFSYVKDTDILKLLNELRASDAQAIAINDERITATSEVSEAGRYIMINGRQMLAPYTIRAIADPDKIEHALKMIGGVVEYLESYQLKVTLEKSDNIVIPKVRDDGSVIKTNLLTPVKQ